MRKRGYRHRRSDEHFSIRGEYARHLQYVYSKEFPTSRGTVVDLIYFGADVLEEKLVVGIFRENPTIEQGVHLNCSATLRLQKFGAEELDALLDKLIPPLKT
jgi:hypothetical protein